MQDLSTCLISFTAGAATGAVQWLLYRRSSSRTQTISEHLNDFRRYCWHASAILAVVIAGLTVAYKRLDLIGEAGVCFWLGWLVIVVLRCRSYLRSDADPDTGDCSAEP